MEIIIYIYIDRPESPYHLDVLDALTDMRRDGYVRSISSLRFPPSLLDEACSVGLGICDVNQVTANILDPNRYYEALSSSPGGGGGSGSRGGRSTGRRNAVSAVSSSSAKVSVSGVQAGGLLTDRYLSRPNLPGPMYLSSSERRHVSTSLERWSDRHPEKGRGGSKSSSSNSNSNWKRYHGTVLQTM